MSILEIIKNDMYLAMKAGDKAKAQTLRTLLAKLKDHQINTNKQLSDQEGLSVIKTLVKQRKESANIYNRVKRTELADKEKFEVSILTSYLPKMMTKEEMQLLIKNIIDEIEAQSKSDIGKVMALVMKRGGNKIDGKIANLFVRELLE